MRRLAVAAAAAISVVAAVIGLVLIGTLAQVAPTPAGDRLGMEAGESFNDYQARSELTLAQASEEPAYALVSLVPHNDSLDAAAQAVQPATRVSAIVFPGLAPVALPEPTAHSTRSEVFALAAKRAAARFDVAQPDRVSAVVVRDRGEVLRRIAAEDNVTAVQVLPPDAVWQAFAIAEVRPAT